MQNLSEFQVTIDVGRTKWQKENVNLFILDSKTKEKSQHEAAGFMGNVVLVWRSIGTNNITVMIVYAIYFTSLIKIKAIWPMV